MQPYINTLSVDIDSGKKKEVKKTDHSLKYLYFKPWYMRGSFFLPSLTVE